MDRRRGGRSHRGRGPTRAGFAPFAALAITLLAAPAAHAALTAVGSRICDANRATIPGVGIDASYTLTDNNDKLIFCAAADDPGGDCRAQQDEGGMTLQYRELAGTWADVPTTNGSGPSLASAGTDLSDNNTVGQPERRCNSNGGFKVAGKEFTSSTNLDYSADWDGNNTEAQWALDFSTDPGSKTYEFRVRWGTKDCGTVNLTYLAQITTATAMILADHTAGQQPDAFTQSGGETPAELFGFELDPGAGPISVTSVVFRLTSIVGLTNGDWTNIDLVEDDNNNGNIDVTPLENTLVGGLGIVDQAAGTVTFPTSFSVTAVTSYILRVTFTSLSDADKVTIDLNSADITAAASVTGPTSTVTHIEGGTSAGGGGFTWLTAASDISLTSTGWQDIDLTTLVPAGATGVVVEIANTDSSNVRRGVLRGKEDTRDYMSNTSYNAISELCHRYQIVKLDSNWFIEGYINDTSVDFRLIGYTSGADPSYFASPPQISPTAGGWTTVDVSAQVDADADGVILFIQNQDAANRVYGMRELTSGDITLSMRNHRSRMHVVGLDAAKKFEAYIQTTGVKIYLVGQTKGSVVYYTNNVAVTDPTTGSWQTRDADNYGVADEATGLFLSVLISGSVTDISFQHGDSSDNYSVRKLNGNQGFQAAAGLNDANLWGEYMGNTGVDVYIAAYTSGGGNWMATGTYTGNGAGQSITGMGFQPDVVIVKRYPEKKGQIRTSTMPAGMSKEIKSTLGMLADRITALDTGGFTVGTHATVNTLNDPYYWIAFKATTGVCQVGSYAGNPPSQTVPVAFQPNYLIVVPEGGTKSVHRSSSVTGDNTFDFEGEGLFGSQITALVATGFDVGNNSSVNSNGATYHYVAFKVSSGQVAVGSYQGDGSVGRAIGAGFQPEWVILHADTTVTAVGGSPGTVHRPASMTGDISLNIGWAWNTETFGNCIQALTSTGFEVGSDNTVNQGPPGSGPMYYWMAFGDGAGGGGGGGGPPRIVRWQEVDPN